MLEDNSSADVQVLFDFLDNELDYAPFDDPGDNFNWVLRRHSPGTDEEGGTGTERSRCAQRGGGGGGDADGSVVALYARLWSDPSNRETENPQFRTCHNCCLSQLFSNSVPSLLAGRRGVIRTSRAILTTRLRASLRWRSTRRTWRTRPSSRCRTRSRSTGSRVRARCPDPRECCTGSHVKARSIGRVPASESALLHVFPPLGPLYWTGSRIRVRSFTLVPAPEPLVPILVSVAHAWDKRFGVGVSRVQHWSTLSVPCFLL